MNYEFEAFNSGFRKGLFTAIATFDIPNEDIGKRMNLDTLNNNIFNMYNTWQNTINSEKKAREDDILQKKIKIQIENLKQSIINYINRRL